MDPKKPGVGLCSFRLARLAVSLGSLPLLFSWRLANIGPEPRRVGGEPAEDMEETELERSVLVSVLISMIIDVVWLL